MCNGLPSSGIDGALFSFFMCDVFRCAVSWGVDSLVKQQWMEGMGSVK